MPGSIQVSPGDVLLLKSSFWPPSVPEPSGSSNGHAWRSREMGGTVVKYAEIFNI